MKGRPPMRKIPAESPWKPILTSSLHPRGAAGSFRRLSAANTVGALGTMQPGGAVQQVFPHLGGKVRLCGRRGSVLPWVGEGVRLGATPALRRGRP